MSAIHPRARALTTLFLPLLLTGCTLPGTPPRIRYFSAETFPAAAEAEATAARPETAVGPPLRLRRIEAAGHLKERIVWRVSEVESGFYELQRWTEPPVEFVERALERELFEIRGLQPSESTRAPALDVELLAFEELRARPPAARIVLVARLYGPDATGILERTFVETRRLESDDPVDLARALATLLRDLVQEVGGAVAAGVQTAHSPP